MNRLLSFAPLLLVMLSLSARPQDATPDSSVRVVREHIHYDINSDGTGTVTAELALSATTRNALNEVSRTLTMNFPRTTCTPDESAQLREIYEHARRDTSAQMTY